MTNSSSIFEQDILFGSAIMGRGMGRGMDILFGTAITTAMHVKPKNSCG